MEEILKRLQGKSMTKKNLFNFLSEINIENFSSAKPINSSIYEDIVIHPIKEELPKEKKRRGRKPKEKPLVEEQPKEKKRRGRKPKEKPLVEETSEEKKSDILKLTKGIHLIVNDLLEKAITNNKLECKFCKYTFSTTGNLHKHFNTSTLCNSMAYDEFKIIVNNF